jgi:hypothetical protein
MNDPRADYFIVERPAAGFLPEYQRAQSFMSELFVFRSRMPARGERVSLSRTTGSADAV